LGKLGPQSPKQEKNASVWQAKIKAAKILKHEPTCNAGGTQSPLKAGSVGDLKENKKPHFLKATHKKTVFYFLVSLLPTTISFACQVYITMLCKQEASPKKSRPLTTI